MPLTNAQRQQRHRASLARRIEKLEAGLLDIIAKLDGNTKPMALEISGIAQNALGLETPPQP